MLSANLALAEECGDTAYILWAGQYNDVGTVTVSNDLDNLYVTYTLDYQNPDCPEGAVDAVFGTLHLWVGENNPTGVLSTMPAVSNGPNAGTPIPGQFPYHGDANGLQSYTFTIPFVELGITDANDACDKLLYFVAHAEVNYLNCDGTPCIDPETGEPCGDTAFGGPDGTFDGDGNFTASGDTGFGGGNGVNVGEPGRWWYYGEYTVCCDFGGPKVPFCKTAYAKGGYVWVKPTRGKGRVDFNPEKLPSLNLIDGRWGWAINVTEQGETEYEIWAGAGLNDTNNGTLVGTLAVSWDGEDVCFLYDLDEGFTMEELHVYAGDLPPDTIAPGQYGYIEDFNDEPVDFWVDCVPAADTDGDGVWVVAHAVVCFLD